MNRDSVSTSEVISQLRLPLIVLVTFAHSYGGVAPGYSLIGSGWDSYEVLKLVVSQTLVKVVVPVFFMISGYLFFRNVETWSLQVYWGKITRRLWTLLLPYVAWNLLMAVKLHFLNFSFSQFLNFSISQSLIFSFSQFLNFTRAGMQTDWLGQAHWMTAPCNMPLWFLRDLMVVSLLTPVLYWVLRRWGGWVMAVLTLVYLSGVGAFPVPGVSMYAIYFFSLGAFMSIHRRDPIAATLSVEKPAYVLSVLLGVAMVLTYRTLVFSPLMLAFRLTGAVAVICLAYRLLSATRHRLPLTVCRASYFLYLGHYVFFLSFIDAWMLQSPPASPSASTLVLCVHYIAAPLVKAALFVAVYVAWCRLRSLLFSAKK